MQTNFKKIISDNPIKLADDLILDICINNNNVTPEIAKKALQLCNYIKELISSPDEFYCDVNVADYKKNPVLKKYRGSTFIDKPEATQPIDNIEKDLIDVIDILDKINKDVLLSNDEINKLKELLLITTMPIWHIKTSQLRQRKFSRSSI